MELGTLEMLGRLALAGVLGVIVGIDRELLNKPAGARTLMMVSFGAAIFTIAGLRLSRMTDESAIDTEALSRIVQGIIGGIGFLGAGVIMNRHGHVRGLTTAAGLWVTAGVGVACGLGEYLLALIAAGLVVLTFTSSRLVHDVEPDAPEDEQNENDQD